MVLGNDGDTVAGLEPFGALSVSTGYSSLFYDSWSGPLDTADKWTVTGTAPSLSGGNMQMSATLSTYNAIRTKDTVLPNSGFTLVRNGISIETAAAVGAGRFWGLGTPATTPAPAVLVQDGIGFEINQADGALLAVTYSAGVRTTVATLTRPADGAIHAYGVYFRVTQAFWFIDNTQVPVASASFPNLTVVELPALIVRQNAAAFTGTPSFVNIAHLTADTSRQATSISDPIIGTRMARVGVDGTLKVSGTGVAGTPSAAVATVQGVAGGTPLPVSLATNTPDVTDRAARLLGVLSAGTNTIGTVVPQPSSLAVTVTAATGVAATLTLPAPAAGQFQHITGIYLTLYSTAARTGVAAPILVTTTNLPGAPVYTFGTAAAIGTTDREIHDMSNPLKSLAAATATTIVAPAVTGGIWRLSATYYTAA